MKILFLHGRQSVVGGVKPTYIKDVDTKSSPQASMTTISMLPCEPLRPSTISTNLM
ncbi:hypothetical protein [Novipirellula aureliae]|uniref:hypothetical protein n=1 Tax=Novipirellula aureliae TaxID=2527966 RepID=UPI001E40AC3C|nr:hypothetical protein [Novipirellula aureliae]